MKYIILIGDGMSDYPLKSLDNKTPLEIAYKPNIDKLTKEGKTGLVSNVPEGFSPGSDVANMSIFGYDPKKYYTGRGPLEAGSMGIDLKDGDVAFRANLITEENGVLLDFNAGHISSEEAAILIEDLNTYFKNNFNKNNFNKDVLNKSKFNGKFYNGISYRHLFVINNKELSDLNTAPPHDIVGEKIADYINWNDESSKIIKDIMEMSKDFLKNHPINKERVEKGKKPANMVWLWGQGLKPSLPNFKKLYGLKGSVITGVDLLKGIGIFAGLDIIEVPGATGYFDTDYNAKGKYASKAIKYNDILFIHVEAPDEAGHSGEVKEKIKAIEKIDKHVLGQILDELEKYSDYKIAILPDHPTPIDVRTHTMDPVPLTIYSSNNDTDEVKTYNELSVKKGSIDLSEGYKLIDYLISN
ncbi:cofactor-independent phosphoglycerate mutase [Methanobrevibacter curvatus]|uniref:2,3-bisphosphoglycerate-independent phosphoglycerate mutase n=1 Tax=Methanobrevibacter curvatus TaxID=49547 RepID=A0A166DEY3_9EURY|nr:cofactor-independent phosphoglycerate mutase [Methanobrevibacter curvatus]KZX15525.1 2,3-bisphosphoglycerate-independent phosphoglycerate mutase [Methanobrevibacter curvatus]